MRGTRPLNNVQIEMDMPFNWRKSIEPEVLPVLEIGEEQAVTLKFYPPKDITPGRYEIRVRSHSLSDDQPVEGEDKNITVEIEAKANMVGTLLLSLLIVGVIGGMVVFGVKLTRK